MLNPTILLRNTLLPRSRVHLSRTFAKTTAPYQDIPSPSSSSPRPFIDAWPRISDVLKSDHRQIESFYERIVTCTDPDEQTRYQNQFTWELARHVVGEELVVYPAFQKYLKDGYALAEKDRRAHQTIKEKLQLFQDLKSTDPRFLPTINSLMHDLRHHIHEEETDDLVLLDESLSQEESESLSRTFDRTKMFVPSRSHPSTPDQPPFETAVGLVTAPVDRLTDLFRKWPLGRRRV